MALYQSGDVVAFEILYQRHSGRVLDFLLKRTSEQNARDLLQETFLKLHRSRRQYSSQYPFLPWLFAITRNAFVDFIRLNETKVARNSADGVEDHHFTRTEEPLKEWASDLTVALKTLPEGQRRAIELRYLSDWSFEKIAADMDMTPVNVRQIVSRGIKRLRSGFGGKST